MGVLQVLAVALGALFSRLTLLVVLHLFAMSSENVLKALGAWFLQNLTHLDASVIVALRVS